MGTEYLDREGTEILHAALDGITYSATYERIPKLSRVEQAIEDLKQEIRMSFAGRFCDWMPKAMIEGRR